MKPVLLICIIFLFVIGSVSALDYSSLTTVSVSPEGQIGPGQTLVVTSITDNSGICGNPGNLYLKTGLENPLWTVAATSDGLDIRTDQYKEITKSEFVFSRRGDLTLGGTGMTINCTEDLHYHIVLTGKVPAVPSFTAIQIQRKDGQNYEMIIPVTSLILPVVLPTPIPTALPTTDYSSKIAVIEQKMTEHETKIQQIQTVIAQATPTPVKIEVIETPSPRPTTDWDQRLKDIEMRAEEQRKLVAEQKTLLQQILEFLGWKS